jgi:hypothetical protein
MRPTKGLISCTPASPQATAWQKANSSVRLQWMPSRFQLFGGADAFPGGGDLDQHPVAADAGGFVQRDQLRARATVAAVSKDRRASTSVLTRPGTTFRISSPKRTSTWSTMAGQRQPRCRPRSRPAAARSRAAARP